MSTVSFDGDFFKDDLRTAGDGDRDDGAAPSLDARVGEVELGVDLSDDLLAAGDGERLTGVTAASTLEALLTLLRRDPGPGDVAAKVAARRAMVGEVPGDSVEIETLRLEGEAAGDEADIEPLRLEGEVAGDEADIEPLRLEGEAAGDGVDMVTRRLDPGDVLLLLDGNTVALRPLEVGMLQNSGLCGQTGIPPPNLEETSLE